MLDQITDRTWFMIGAVIVGGLLVKASSTAFPEIFNTVITGLKNAIPSMM